MEALTLNQCRTLRLHHATQMVKHLKAEVRLIDVSICQNLYRQYHKCYVIAKFFVIQDFPPTKEQLLRVAEKETKLQEAEAKEKDSASHCLAWTIKSCLFQRATGTTRCRTDRTTYLYFIYIAFNTQ